MDYQIFFITGLPKSGTTWMMNMLNSIDGICCLGEGKFFSSGLTNVPSLYDAIKNGIYNWHNFIAHRKNNWLNLDKHITTINKTNILPNKVLERSLQKETDTIIRKYIIHLFNKAKQQNTILIGDKSPLLYTNEFSRIIRIFPEAKIIFLIRDLENFIISILFHFWRSNKDNRSDKSICLFTSDDFIIINNFLTSGNNMKKIARTSTIKRLANIWKNTNSFVYKKSKTHKQILIVYYNKLKLQPYRHLKNILDFLNINIEKDSINNIIEKNSIDNIMKSNNTVLQEHINKYKVKLNYYIDDNINKLIENYQLYLDTLIK